MSNPYTRVYDRNYQSLGTLPNETRAAVLSTDGSRAYAYTYDSVTTSSQLRVFDLTVNVAGGAYSQVGSSIPVNPGYSTSYPVVMTISQDGGGIFIAGPTQIEVRPAAP